MSDEPKAEHVGGVLDVLAYMGDHSEWPSSGINSVYVREVKAAWRAERACLLAIKDAAEATLTARATGNWDQIQVATHRLRHALSALPEDQTP